MNDLELFEELALEQKAGRPVVLATVIQKSGSVPRNTGARMIIWANGSARGTIGGGCVEAAIRVAARRIHLDSKKPETVQVHLTDLAQGGTGDVCGGHMDVFLDYLTSEAYGATIK
jgi:xanthine dehydrogenase accessory factor